MAGLFDYEVAKRIDRERPPFDALIMAAAMRADTVNFAKLHAAFPELVDETSKRHNAPGGRLPDEIDPPTACKQCGASYDACTRSVLGNTGACCGTCVNTATHGPNQHRWEAYFGMKTVAEVRGA